MDGVAYLGVAWGQNSDILITARVQSVLGPIDAGPFGLGSIKLDL